MKTKLLLSTLLSFYFCLLSSQVPQGFNYQAVARDGTTGTALTNQALNVRISIQPAVTSGGEFWIETHSVTTDQFGVMVLVIGTGTQTGGSASAFSDIDWSTQPLYMKTEIDKGSGYMLMGTTQLWSVPYSMVAGNLNGSLNQLEVDGKTTTKDPALFAVRNAAGDTVFAVYNEAVRVHVSDGSKGKGGFAIGGFGTTGKDGIDQNYLVVDPGNINMYIDDTGKGKGGFAIGGFGSSGKGGASFLNVNTDASGIINPSVNRILWYPLKDAFLTGNVLVTDPNNVGINSFASGYQSMAAGQYSQALGYQTQALGDYSTAIGKLSIAGARSGGTSTASNAFAFGNVAQATGDGSYAFGAGAIASGTGSFAFGSVGHDTTTFASTGVYTTALGEYSFALGQGSQTTGVGAISLGVDNTSSGNYAISLGYNNQATNILASSFGALNVASGYYSTALGFASTASGSESVAIGSSAKSVGAGSIAMGIEYGQLSLGGGGGWFAQSEADGFRSVAIGSGVTASSCASFVVGQQNEIPSSFNSYSWVATDPLFVIGNGNGATGSTPNRSNAVTVLKNGNVGVGTSTPSSKLEVDVSGTSIYAGIGIKSSLTEGRLITLNQNVGGKLNFTALTGMLADNLVTFDYTTDNVGIGTNSPAYSLHAYGTNAALIAHYSGNTRGGISALTSQRLALLTTANTDNIVFGYTSDINQTNFSTNFVEQIRLVTSTGNFGIGTSSPAKKLSVNGDALITGGIYVGSGYSSLYNYFNNPFIQQGWAGGWGNYTALNSSWDWTGNIGSVITCEGYPLLVMKGASGSPYQTTLFTVDISGNVNMQGNVYMPSVYGHTTGGTYHVLYIDNSGNIGGIASSARYKKNISNMENTNWLYNLRPVNFTYKSDSLNIKQYGLIAEEVEQINPLFVIYNKEGKPESVNYDMFISPLLKAAQDQEHKIEGLEQDNQQLRSELGLLKEKIEQIATQVEPSGTK